MGSFPNFGLSFGGPLNKDYSFSWVFLGVPLLWENYYLDSNKGFSCRVVGSGLAAPCSGVYLGCVSFSGELALEMMRQSCLNLGSSLCGVQMSAADAIHEPKESQGMAHGFRGFRV